jgi:UMP-CMP kinase
MNHISAGELLRDEIKRPNSEYAALITDHMKSDHISGPIPVPAGLTIELLYQKMQEAKASRKRGFLIDGFPRSEEQALAFDENVRIAHSDII